MCELPGTSAEPSPARLKHARIAARIFRERTGRDPSPAEMEQLLAPALPYEDYDDLEERLGREPTLVETFDHVLLPALDLMHMRIENRDNERRRRGQ